MIKKLTNAITTVVFYYNVNESLKRLIHSTIYVSKFSMISVEILSRVAPYGELFLYLIRTKEYVRRDKHRKEKIQGKLASIYDTTIAFTLKNRSATSGKFTLCS